MNVITSFLSGLVAAFTPCVIILIPALLYSFFPTEKQSVVVGSSQSAKKLGSPNRPKRKQSLQILFFILSFVITYSLFALFLKQLLTSSVKYGLQLGIGLLFAVMGILALLKKFNPVSFPVIKNKWLFGSVFALIISINPCTFAYLGVLIGTTKTSALIGTMIFFSLGLLTPAILFLFFGKKLLQRAKKISSLTHTLDVGMNILLVAIGAYLMFTIKSFGILDVYVSGALLVVTFIILLRSFYFLRGWKELKNPINFFIVIALLLISGAILVHCHGGVKSSVDENTYVSPFTQEPIVQQDQGEQCSANVTTCALCRRCMSIFGVGAGLGFLAVAGAEFLRRKQLKREQEGE